VCDSIIALSKNYIEWVKEYSVTDGNYVHNSEVASPLQENWFEL